MIVIRVSVNPALLRWARERSGVARGKLVARFEKLPDWEGGRVQPTVKQLEAYARAVHVSVGYLFLTEPPDEPVPIPDFRTDSGKGATRLSPDLLDIVYACQERQNWYEDYVRASGQPILDFVDSVTVDTAPEIVADEMRQTLEFDLSARQRTTGAHETDIPAPTARRTLQRLCAAGVLLEVSSGRGRRPGLFAFPDLIRVAEGREPVATEESGD